MPEQHADGFFPQSLGLQNFPTFELILQNFPTFELRKPTRGATDNRACPFRDVCSPIRPT